jgi:hypothetical protein
LAEKQKNKTQQNTRKTPEAETQQTEGKKQQQPKSNHAIQRTPLPLIKQEWSLRYSTNEPLPRHQFYLLHHITNFT